MKNVHSLYELRFAQKACKDIPEIQKVMDKMVDLCYDYMEYREVGEVHAKILDAKTMLEVQYKHYKEVFENKGSIR